MRSVIRIAKNTILLLLLAYFALLAFLYLRQTHFIFFPATAVQITPSDFGRKFEEVAVPCSFGCATGDSLAGWWLPPQQPNPSSSESQVILYLHGNAGNIGDNAAHAVRLNRLGPAVFIFDYRGYGRSQGPFPSEARVNEDAESAWSYLVHQRKIESRHIVIYGHSLGSGIALALAVRHPEAGGLIMESSYTSIHDMSVRNMIFRALPLGLLISQRFNSIDRVGELKIPVMFIHGADDKLIPAEMSRRLYAAAPQPKKLLIIPGAEHDNSAAVGGDLYLGPVSDFLHSLPPGNLGLH